MYLYGKSTILWFFLDIYFEFGNKLKTLFDFYVIKGFEIEN